MGCRAIEVFVAAAVGAGRRRCYQRFIEAFVAAAGSAGTSLSGSQQGSDLVLSLAKHGSILTVEQTITFRCTVYEELELLIAHSLNFRAAESYTQQRVGDGGVLVEVRGGLGARGREGHVRAKDTDMSMPLTASLDAKMAMVMTTAACTYDYLPTLSERSSVLGNQVMKKKLWEGLGRKIERPKVFPKNAKPAGQRSEKWSEKLFL